MLFMGHSLFVKSHKNSNLLLFSFCFLLTVHCLITELSESHDCFCTEALSAPACMVLELHEHQGKQSLKNYVYCAGYLFWWMAKVSAEMSTINLNQKKCLKIPWLKNVLHLKFQPFKVLRVYIHVRIDAYTCRNQWWQASAFVPLLISSSLTNLVSSILEVCRR